ncbi:hypothetical protein [Pseudomonas sp. PGPR40]|uniref:hypothetical protein n=1 Tax=Pseudomonas sp. PGPR40 TaxID=2913476 RepID=UPI001EDBD4C2|nr:hypothetical protein [Pseudomonas sp. PGPR40]
MFIGVFLPYATHKTPSKHMHWYKNWYEIHSLSGVLPTETQLNLPAIPRLCVQNTIDFFQTAQREAERCHAGQSSIKKRPKRWRITWPGAVSQRCGIGCSLQKVRWGAGENDIALIGSALAISLFDLATPRSLIGTIRKCISCSILDKKPVSTIRLATINRALIDGQRFNSLT